MPVSELLLRWSARELTELQIYFKLEMEEAENPQRPEARQQTPEEMLAVLQRHSPKKNARR